jgi:hypothetical protein
MAGLTEYKSDMNMKTKMFITALVFLIGMIVDVFSTHYAFLICNNCSESNPLGFMSPLSIVCNIIGLTIFMCWANKDNLLSYLGIIFSLWRIIFIGGNNIFINHQTIISLLLVYAAGGIMFSLLYGASEMVEKWKFNQQQEIDHG